MCKATSRLMASSIAQVAALIAALEPSTPTMIGPGDSICFIAYS
jgi:hypothetical protein